MQVLPLGVGVEPDVTILDGLIAVSLPVGDGLRLTTYRPDGTPVSTRVFPHASYGRFGGEWLGYKQAAETGHHPAAFNLRTGVVRTFDGQIDGDPGVVISEATHEIVWQTELGPRDARVYEVFAHPLTGDGTTRTLGHVGAPDGIDGLDAQGRVVLRRELDTIDPAVGGKLQRAGACRVGQYGFGLGVRFDDWSVTRWLLGGSVTKDPRVATEGSIFAIVSWGPVVRVVIATKAELATLPPVPTGPGPVDPEEEEPPVAVQWPLAPNMKHVVEQVIKEHPEINLNTDATRQAILPHIVKRLNKPGEFKPWGLKAKKKPDHPLDSDGEFNTDAVNFLRPDDLMEIIDVIANGKAFWDPAHSKTPTKQGTNGWWMAAPDPGDDQIPEPGEDTHTYIGGGNDTGTCDQCGKPRADPVHDTPESMLPHAYDGGEQDTGVCDVCGFPESGLRHRGDSVERHTFEGAGDFCTRCGQPADNLAFHLEAAPVDLPPSGDWAVEAAAIRAALAKSDARVAELAAAVDALEQQLAGGASAGVLTVKTITLTVGP